MTDIRNHGFNFLVDHRRVLFNFINVCYSFSINGFRNSAATAPTLSIIKSARSSKVLNNIMLVFAMRFIIFLFRTAILCKFSSVIRTTPNEKLSAFLS